MLLAVPLKQVAHTRGRARQVLGLLVPRREPAGHELRGDGRVLDDQHRRRGHGPQVQVDEARCGGRAGRQVVGPVGGEVARAVDVVGVGGEGCAELSEEREVA